MDRCLVTLDGTAAPADGPTIERRPKLENFGDVSYPVAYGAQGVGDALVEVHCFYSRTS